MLVLHRRVGLNFACWLFFLAEAPFEPYGILVRLEKDENCEFGNLNRRARRRTALTFACLLSVIHLHTSLFYLVFLYFLVTTRFQLITFVGLGFVFNWYNGSYRILPSRKFLL